MYIRILFEIVSYGDLKGTNPQKRVISRDGRSHTKKEKTFIFKTPNQETQDQTTIQTTEKKSSNYPENGETTSSSKSSNPKDSESIHP